jgi:hypothetical protein
MIESTSRPQSHCLYGVGLVKVGDEDVNLCVSLMP